MLRVPLQLRQEHSPLDSSSNDGKSAQVNKKPSSYKPHVIPQALHNRDIAKKE